MKTGRNDPCPCGSGKKYKKCCLNKTGDLSSAGMDSEGFIKSDLPKKVKDYFLRVERETQGNIILKAVSSLPSGMVAASNLEKGNRNIIISVVLRAFKNKTDLCQSLVHEATHGLLLYGKGYYMLEPETGTVPSLEEIQLRNILGTMIDDIIVNFTIKQEGFAPFSEKYIPMVEKETECIIQGKDIYATHLQTGMVFYSKFKIFRYMLAWSFIEYFNLEDEIVLLLRKYLECFKDKFPKEYAECKEIIILLKKYNIFSPENHKIVCEEISKLWGLDKKMRMVKLV